MSQLDDSEDEDDVADYVLLPEEVTSDQVQVHKTASRRLAMASLQSQYDDAREEEDRSDEFSLSDLEFRFGIRHLVVISILVAFSIRATQRFGLEAGVGLGFVVLLLTMLYFIYDLQQQKRKRLRRLQRGLEVKKDLLAKKSRAQSS